MEGQKRLRRRPLSASAFSRSHHPLPANSSPAYPSLPPRPPRYVLVVALVDHRAHPVLDARHAPNRPRRAQWLGPSFSRSTSPPSSTQFVHSNSSSPSPSPSRFPPSPCIAPIPHLSLPKMNARPQKQSMSELKFRRLVEHNQRLKEDLNRPRIRVSEASTRYVLPCSCVQCSA